MPTPPFPTRREIEASQLAQLQALLARLGSGNAFYAPRLAAAGLARGVRTLEDFRRRLPPTTKAQIIADQLEHPPYGSNLTAPLDRYTRYSQTSGTTATPMRWLDTPESWAWVVDNWVTVMRAAGVGVGDRVYFAFSFGPFLGFWAAFDAAARLGCLVIPGGGLSTTARLRAMLENGVTVLCCTPTYALRLGETAAAEGLDLSAGRVRTIIVGGEPGGSIPATRSRIESLFSGARVWDHHGMTEVGPVSFECPARRGVLHVIEAAYLPEVVDPDTLEPVGPGGGGELVLTNLGRGDAPLLRYRTGDVVRRAGAAECTCGRADLALEGGIIGRSDDMVVVRGVNVFPSAIEDVFRRLSGIAEYRVDVHRQRELAELTVTIEPASDVARPQELARRAEASLRESLALRVPVRLAEPGSLPRFEMKARRWVRSDGQTVG